MATTRLNTLDDYLMGRAVKYPITDEMRMDAQIMVDKSNLILVKFGNWRRINSGYRPFEINNLLPHAKPRSNHIKCRAIDLDDRDGKLDEFCLNNLEYLEEIGLWLESPDNTPGWTHLQIVIPASKNRVFFA